jgi:hypothetical protein
MPGLCRHADDIVANSAEANYVQCIKKCTKADWCHGFNIVWTASGLSCQLSTTRAFPNFTPNATACQYYVRSDLPNDHLCLA